MLRPLHISKKMSHNKEHCQHQLLQKIFENIFQNFRSTQMAEPLRLRSRRDVLRRSNVVRHADDDVSYRKWTAVVCHGPEVRQRSERELLFDEREDEPHEGIAQTLFGNLKQQSLLRRNHDSLSQQDRHFQSNIFQSIFNLF